MTELEQICELVRYCGGIMLKADRSRLGIDEKDGQANFVTVYDKQIERILKKGLLEIIPDAVFIGEEGDQAHFSDKGKFYIVDPIDGTTNFIKNYKVSSISVGLIENGEGKYGVVYDPYKDEMFTAEAGKGAFCNNEPIHVSSQPLERGIVLFGTSPYYAELSRRSFDMAYEYFTKALDIRRSGSAALDLCSIAAGRAELYFELSLFPWDFAAGALIVKEAGGTVTTVDGGEMTYDKSCSCLAVNRR